MFAAILASAFLLLAGAVAQSDTSETEAPGFLTIQTSVPDFRPPTTSGSIFVTDSCIGDGCGTTATGDIMSILPISTSVSISLPQATTGLESIVSETGVMTIPEGVTPTVSSTSSQSGSASGSGTSSPSSSTGAASALQVPGCDKLTLLPLALSTLFVAIGGAWTLA